VLYRKTTFILGAGASCEAGLPNGAELALRVASCLDLRFGHGCNQVSGSPLIADALYKVAATNFEFDPCHYGCWMIRDAMPLALSIDNFIDSHRGNKEIELCGKLAIAETILEAERNSKLYVDSTKRESLNHSLLEGTWYIRLAQLLTENVSKAEVRSIFQNASFVVFNYDRCLEHFLAHALRTYYDLDLREAQSLVNSASFLHPYGTVGHLNWQDPRGIPFGAEVDSNELLKITRTLRTFTEHETDRTQHGAIASRIEDAEILVFLGFAFHDQNLKVLKPQNPSRARRVFATAFGISPSDKVVIDGSVVALIGVSSGMVRREIRTDLKCVDLFNEFWRSFRSG